MGAGKKKKHQSIALTPAITDVDALNDCPACAAQGYVANPDGTIHHIPGAATTECSAHLLAQYGALDPITTHTVIHLFPNTNGLGIPIPAWHYANLDAAVKATVTTMSAAAFLNATHVTRCANCGQFTSANATATHICPTGPPFPDGGVSLLGTGALVHGEHVNSILKTFLNEHPSPSNDFDPEYHFVVIDTTANNPGHTSHLQINANPAGMFDWSHHKFYRDGEIAEEIGCSTTFESPQAAYADYLKQMAASTVKPIEGFYDPVWTVPIHNGTFTQQWATIEIAGGDTIIVEVSESSNHANDPTWIAYQASTIEEIKANSAHVITSGTVPHDEAGEVDKFVFDLVGSHLGRCINCGQFVSLDAANSHTCPHGSPAQPTHHHQPLSTATPPTQTQTHTQTHTQVDVEGVTGVDIEGWVPDVDTLIQEISANGAWSAPMCVDSAGHGHTLEMRIELDDLDVDDLIAAHLRVYIADSSTGMLVTHVVGVDGFVHARDYAITLAEHWRCDGCGQFRNPTAPHTCPTSDIIDPVPVADTDPVGAGMEGQAALTALAADASEHLTPVPKPGEIPAGDGHGAHLLVGGSDFYDSAVTIFNHIDAKDPANVRQALFAELTGDAETKLLASLAIGTDYLDKQVTEAEVAPLASDTAWSDIEKTLKSVGYHLKQGDELPAHTLAAITMGISENIDAMKAAGAGDPLVDAAVTQYQGVLDELQSYATDWPAKQAAYTATGAKPDKATQFTAEQMITKTIQVPVDGLGILPVKVTKSSLPATTQHADGTTHWDGKFAATADGTQYAIDLGDGYTAYYRPRNNGNLPNGVTLASRVGQLDVVAPAGVDDPAALLEHTSKLYLNTDPLTAGETEWTYLQANIFAQKLASNPKVVDALKASTEIVGTKATIMEMERQGQLQGLTETQQNLLIASIAVAAERATLPQRTALLRDAVAVAAGYESTAAMVTSGAYAPTPHLSRTGAQWQRFDITAEQINKKYKAAGRGLHHSVANTSYILDMLSTGSLLCQTRRKRMGVGQKGISETADAGKQHAARFVYTRCLTSGASTNVGLWWDKPGTLLSRANQFGSPNDKWGEKSSQRHPDDYLGFNGGSNEILFADGIDLFGPEAPTRINLPAHLKAKARQIVLSRGITEVNGIPINKWIP